MRIIRRIFDRIPTYIRADQVRVGDRITVRSVSPKGRKVGTVTRVRWTWPNMVIDTTAGGVVEHPDYRVRIHH